MKFLFSLKTMEMQREYNFVSEKVFSGQNMFFFRVLLDSRGKYRIAMTRFLLERKFCDVISLKVEQPIPQNFAGLLASSVPLLVPNFKSIR